MSTYVITYVRRVSLLSLGCPSWYVEEKLKKNTLTKSVPRAQLKRNDTLLSDRIDLGQKYDAWLTDQVPDVTNRLKRLHVSVDHGGPRPMICWFYQGVRLFAHYVMLCFMYLISYFTYGTVCMYICVLLDLVFVLVCILNTCMYVCRHYTHLLLHYNYVSRFINAATLYQ